MPIIAVGAAVAASVVAGSAVAATVGGIAAISAVTAFEVVAAVGATVAAVGAVTRNKTLTMVGGAIGLIGGIGGLASAAGVFGATAASGAPIFGAAPAASTTGSFAEGLTPEIAGQVGGAVDTGTFGGEAASGVAAADAASSNTIPFIANGLPPGQDSFTTLSTTSERMADPATTLTDTAAKSTAIDPAEKLTASVDPTKGLINQPEVQPVGTTPMHTSSAVDSGNFGDVNTNPDFAAGRAAGNTADLNPAQYSGADKGIFGNILKFANDNKNLASGIMTVGGKFLEGAFSEVDPAKIRALNSQAAANDAATALANMQRTNLQMPKSVASSAPVTGAVNPIIPQRPGQGLINQPQLAPVTGAVA